MFGQAVLVQNRTWLEKFLLVLCGSFLIALFARISIPLPFSPVPIALASHVCLFLGVMLGSRMAAWAVLLYIMQGVIGLPVFALGHAGIGVLLGPRGGYLIGYLLAAWLTGYIVERSKSKTAGQACMAMIAGNLMIYLCGLSQLALFVGIERVFMFGFFPFLLGDCLKLGMAYRSLKTLKRC